MSKKNNVIENTNTYLDDSTGEIVCSNKVTSVLVGQEPEYYKVYVNAVTDIANMCDLSDSDRKVFLSLARNMSFKNVVILMKPIKEMIMEETGIKSMNTINKSIDNLYKANFLLRQSRGFYIVNPNIAGKGKWEDIKALRLIIEYDKNGKRIKLNKINSNFIEIEETLDNPKYLDTTEEKKDPRQKELF